MFPFLLTLLPSSIASYLLTKILGHESRIAVLVISAIIGFPIGITVNAFITGHVVVTVPVVVGVIIGPIAGYIAAAPFMIGM